MQRTSCEQCTKPPADAEETKTIRAKWLMDGATTLSEAATRLRETAHSLEGLERAGWQLEQPVKDDYGFIHERKEAVVMRSYCRRIETEADIQAALDWAVEHEQLCEGVTREEIEAWLRDRLDAHWRQP